MEPVFLARSSEGSKFERTNDQDLDAFREATDVIAVPEENRIAQDQRIDKPKPVTVAGKRPPSSLLEE